MVERTNVFYFTVFIFVIIAFIFHINAMGHHHWKHINVKNVALFNASHITIGLFTQCRTKNTTHEEICFPNIYLQNGICDISHDCMKLSRNESCHCDYLPSTKGIAACAIIAAVFLGLAVLILFLHSIKTTGSRSLELILSLFPLISLILAFIFVLIALILVGSYLSRDLMFMVRNSAKDNDLTVLRNTTSDIADIQIGWSTGLEIIALFFSFISFVLYSVYVFKIGRSS